MERGRERERGKNNHNQTKHAHPTHTLIRPKSQSRNEILIEVGWQSAGLRLCVEVW